ncbi:hypothetical protein, partial [Deinococcus ficus]|uniref:hypothetical protein n=1 Tax=Deinococcus ficus TaxID=317577 RepID=UPI001E5D0540
MTSDHTKPGELADLLRVTGRTVQRMGNAYIEVFGPDALLPDPRHRDHRVFPPVAVERLQRAADLTRLHRGLSTRQALESIRDGQELAKPRTRPTPAPSDALMERLLEEVQRLQLEMLTLRRDLLDRYAPERPDTAPPAPTPDPDPAPVAAAPPRPAQRPARLQEKHQELLDSLHMGETLKVRPGGRTGEIAELHDIYGTPLRQIDPRTIAAMLRYGLLERVGDQYHAAPDALRQDVTPP